MSAGTGYTPPAAPPCAYEPRMTRAEAQALAAAAGLDENCVVVITDGPTIGTAGNTSATEVTLQPVSPTEFADEALVHTTFSAQAWHGQYDIANNVFHRLTDDWGNTAVDSDANALTVMTQVPWHMGAATFRDNYFEDATLTGWDALPAGKVILDNDIRSTTFTWLPGTLANGTVSGNRLSNGCNITAGLSSFFTFSANDAQGWTFNNQSATTQSITASNNKVTGGPQSVVNIDATHIGGVTISGNTIKAGYVIHLNKVSGTANVSNSDLIGHGLGAIDMDLKGAGTFQFNDCEHHRLGATALANIDIDGAVGAGAVAISTGVRVSGASRIFRDPASTGPLTITAGTTISGATIIIGPANSAATNVFQAVTMPLGTYTLNGPAAPGRNDFTAGAILQGTVTVAATATAGVNIQGGRISGTVNQNRTAGTGSTALFDCDVRGQSTINDNGTANPGVGVSLARLSVTDSVVNIGNLGVLTGAGVVAQQLDIIGSTLNISGLTGTRLLDKGRLQGASLTNAGFQSAIFELVGMTKTMTADQNNRLGNVSFDNWV